jgi:RpiR family carbohydrate utilization transcriptional regulator
MSGNSPVAFSVAAAIRSRMAGLQPSDERVARVLLEQPEAVPFKSVTEIAELAQTSTATVVRCAQKLGFKGFHELKLAFAREQQTFAAALGDAPSDIDPRLAVLHQVAVAGAQTVRDAAGLVDPGAFDGSVSALARAARVLFVGVGTSAPLAQDAAYRFAAIGLSADAPADVHVQHVRARLLGADDVVVAISHTGSTRETLNAVGAAKTAGAVALAITSFARSPLTDLVDFAMVAGSREMPFRLEAMASRLAHLALLDALLVAVAERDGERADAAMELYTDILGEHRL